MRGKNKTREEYNVYMREYMLRRYHARRSKAIEELGGKCVNCGSISKLELDHIDANAKEINLGRLWSIAESRFKKELLKCQLLCDSCHEYKTVEDFGLNHAKGTHGTLSAYRYCGPPKCVLCKEAKMIYTRKNRLLNK